MSVILFESTLGRMLRAARGGGVHDSLDAIPITWSAEMPDPILQALRQRPVLNNEVQFTLAGEVRRIVLTRIGAEIRPDTVYSQQLRDRVTQLFVAEAPALQKRVNDAIAASLKVSGAWDAYRLDSGKEVARVGLTLLFLAVGAAASPPTLGASLALTLLSTVRGLTDAAKKFAEAYRTAEESRTRVIAEIEALRALYRKSPALARTTQIGGAAAHALTVGKLASLGKRDLLPGFTRIKTELNAYKGKVGHLGEYSERLARRLYDQLEQIDAYIDRHGPGAALRPRLWELRDRVTALLELGVPGRWHGFRGTFTITEAWQKCQREMAQIAAVEAMFKDVKALENHEKAVLIADRAVTLLANSGVALASYNAPMALPHPHSAADATDALRLTHAGDVQRGGVAAFVLGFMRQFMSLFKDVHALAKELGIVTAGTSDISAQAAEIQAEFNGVIAAPQAPRLPHATLGEVARAPGRMLPPQKPAPTRPLPPVPPPTRPLPPIPAQTR